MNSFEWNKIFAAILVAGITAMLGAFIGDILIHPHELKEDVVAIEGVVEAGAAVDSGPAGPEPIMHLIATADITKGEKLSKACAACHSFDQGGPNKVGPNLYAVVGGPKAHIPSFAYSDALKAKSGAWGYDSLNHFFWKPKSYIEGTKMNYVGLKKPEDRAALIAWLRAQGSSSFPLPSEAEITAEAAAFGPKEEPSVSPPEAPPADAAPAPAAETPAVTEAPSAPEAAPAAP